jgi:hypothetical protein
MEQFLSFLDFRHVTVKPFALRTQQDNNSASRIFQADLRSLESSHVFDTSISQHVSSRSTIQTPYTTHPRLQKQWAEARGYEIVRRNHSKDKFDKIRKIWVIRGKGGKIRSIKSLNDGEPPQGS